MIDNYTESLSKDYKNQQKVLHSPFDPKIHEKTFVNYLEVVISPNGIIEYAVPSHLGALEMKLLQKYNIKYDMYDYSIIAGNLCPKERFYDYTDWLMEETGYIMVWGELGSRVLGTLNEKQLEALKMLEKENLFIFENKEKTYEKNIFKFAYEE